MKLFSIKRHYFQSLDSLSYNIIINDGNISRSFSFKYKDRKSIHFETKYTNFDFFFKIRKFTIM